jgi:TPR repeat protein
MVAGFLGAMALSAIAAMVVVNIVPAPTTSADVIKSEERAPKGNSFAAATLGDLAKVSEAQAKMTRADEQVVPAETLLAAAPPPNDIAAPKPPGPTSPPPAIVEPARPEIATPLPAPSPVPAASASPALPQEEVASMLKRGRDLIASGDIASARLMLTLVAEGGNAEAAFALAGTFDPTVLANLRAIGVQGDPAKARTWYARAAELGSLEARQRLQALR